jgi:large subunit ribosomal protein L4e
MRRGPLVVYNKNDGVYQAFRNVPGVDVCPVTALGLLRLAPGGHVGRFIIFSEGAFKRLDALYGTYRKKASEKSDYQLPRPQMSNADVVRLINSDEVQSVVLPSKAAYNQRRYNKKNPLTNLNALLKINPYAKTMKRNALLFEEARKAQKAKLLAEKRK